MGSVREVRPISVFPLRLLRMSPEAAKAINLLGEAFSRPPAPDAAEHSLQLGARTVRIRTVGWNEFVSWHKEFIEPIDWWYEEDPFAFVRVGVPGVPLCFLSMTTGLKIAELYDFTHPELRTIYLASEARNPELFAAADAILWGTDPAVAWKGREGAH
jgi:hypothetical protein